MRTTLNPELQKAARTALVEGLVKYDETQGYRGAVTTLEAGGEWGAKLAEIKALSDIAPWRLATVLEVTDQGAYRLPSGSRSLVAETSRRSANLERSRLKA